MFHGLCINTHMNIVSLNDLIKASTFVVILFLQYNLMLLQHMVLMRYTSIFSETGQDITIYNVCRLNV
jgi:hypothetical protein